MGEYDVTDKYSTQTPKKSTLFSGLYLRNRSTLDIGVLGYIGIVWPKEHSSEVSHIPPVTPCIWKTIVRQVRYLLECNIWLQLVTVTLNRANGQLVLKSVYERNDNTEAIPTVRVCVCVCVCVTPNSF